MIKFLNKLNMMMMMTMTNAIMMIMVMSLWQFTTTQAHHYAYISYVCMYVGINCKAGQYIS